MARSPARRWCSAVVIGAGTGLGREIALGLAAQGCIVFGTATTKAEVSEVGIASAGRVSLAVCNIAKQDAVQAWAGGVSDALDGAGLDILISVPRVDVSGPIETLALSAIRHLFETSVFGPLSVTNTLLPALRIARGRILQLSSWTASLPLPFDGAAGAVMAAIEAFSSVYRAELKPFGIEVLVISLGEGMLAGPAEVDTSLNPARRKLYGQRLASFYDRPGGKVSASADWSAAAARVVALAEEASPAGRVAIDQQVAEVLRVAREQPDAERDALRLHLAGLG